MAGVGSPFACAMGSMKIALMIVFDGRVDPMVVSLLRAELVDREMDHRREQRAENPLNIARVGDGTRAA